MLFEVDTQIKNRFYPLLDVTNLHFNLFCSIPGVENLSVKKLSDIKAKTLIKALAMTDIPHCQGAEDIPTA